MLMLIKQKRAMKMKSYEVTVLSDLTPFIRFMARDVDAAVLICKTYRISSFTFSIWFEWFLLNDLILCDV